MARPAGQDSDRTRERIVDACTVLFAQEGFSAVTTRRLADASGVNVATLSYHFGNKEGVYRACVDAVYSRLSMRAVDLLPRLLGSAVEEIMRGVYRLARDEERGIRLLLREVLDHGRLTSMTEEAHFLPGIEQWASLLAQLPAEVRPESEAHARVAVVSVGFLVSRYATMDEESLRSALGLERRADVEPAVVRALTTTALSLVRSR